MLGFFATAFFASVALAFLFSRRPAASLSPFLDKYSSAFL